MSGRYVIVQMDNGEGVSLNLREVIAFGKKGEASVRSLLEGYLCVVKAFEQRQIDGWS